MYYKILISSRRNYFLVGQAIRLSPPAGAGALVAAMLPGGAGNLACSRLSAGSLPERIHMPRRPHVDHALHNRRRRKHRLPQIIPSEHLELVSAADDRKHTLLGSEIDPPRRGHWRREVRAQGPEPTAKDDLPTPSVHTRHNAAIRDRIHAPLVVQRNRNLRHSARL